MPLTFACPRDDCAAVECNRFDLIEHVRAAHHDYSLGPGDVVSTFEPQVVAQGGRRFSAHIMCRGCMRDTARSDTDPTFRHLDDDTPACLDPDTLKPYPTQGAEEMTRIRPTTKDQREWYSSLDDETRTAVRAQVSKQIEAGTPQPEAWTNVRTLTAVESHPVIDPVAKPAPPAPKPARATTRPAERSSAPRSAVVSFWLNDKPKRNLSDLAYDATRGMGAGDAPRMNAAQFREWLTEQSIVDPNTTAWTLTLPNGNVCRTTVRTPQTVDAEIREALAS